MNTNDLSRRQFVTASVAAGFAASVTPVLGSSIITTDTSGLEAGETEFKSAEYNMMAYFAKPVGKNDLPVVVLVQEIFGLHEHIRDLCRRLAKSGYLAIAPNLYQRQGDPTKVNDINQLVSGIVRNVPDTQVMSDIDALCAQLARWGGDVNRVAITGFCWGGRITWLYSAHSSKIKAGVAWYGRVQSAPTELQPLSPVDVAAKLHAPVLGLYGSADGGIPVTTVDAMRDALEKAKSNSRIHLYDGAPHGFNADYRDSYRADIAVDGWQKMLAWFAQYGVK